jgi:hypothetical protein
MRHCNQQAHFFDITSIFLRYNFDLLDRRNIEVISVIFRINKLPGKHETGN